MIEFTIALFIICLVIIQILKNAESHRRHNESIYRNQAENSNNSDNTQNEQGLEQELTNKY